MIYLSRIIELSNFSSHGESRTVTEDLFVTNLRIHEFSSHGELRMVMENLSIPNLRISELFFTRRIADGHGGFLWHETFTLDILNNEKEFAN